jgi:hypothetical protein
VWSVNNSQRLTQGLGSGVWVTALRPISVSSTVQFQDSTHKTSNIYTVVTNRRTRTYCRNTRKMDRLPNLITSDEITLADVVNNNGELNPLIYFPLRMCYWKSWFLIRFTKMCDGFHPISASHLIAQIIYQLIVRWLKQSTCYITCPLRRILCVYVSFALNL